MRFKKEEGKWKLFKGSHLTVEQKLNVSASFPVGGSQELLKKNNGATPFPGKNGFSITVPLTR